MYYNGTCHLRSQLWQYSAANAAAVSSTQTAYPHRPGP